MMTCDPSDRMSVPLLWMKIFPHSGQINPGSLMAVEIIYKTYSVFTNAWSEERCTKVNCDCCGAFELDVLKVVSLNF